jgi:hypothetical protein
MGLGPHPPEEGGVGAPPGRAAKPPQKQAESEQQSCYDEAQATQPNSAKVLRSSWDGTTRTVKP